VVLEKLGNFNDRLGLQAIVTQKSEAPSHRQCDLVNIPKLKQL